MSTPLSAAARCTVSETGALLFSPCQAWPYAPPYTCFTTHASQCSISLFKNYLLFLYKGQRPMVFLVIAALLLLVVPSARCLENCTSIDMKHAESLGYLAVVPKHAIGHDAYEITTAAAPLSCLQSSLPHNLSRLLSARVTSGEAHPIPKRVGGLFLSWLGADLVAQYLNTTRAR